MHNILVTGSNGQLGNELRLVVDEKDKANNYFFTDVEELDITNKTSVSQFLHANNIDVVVNCAAYTNVDKAEDEKEIADLINHIGVKNLAESCKERDGFMIHISTDYVFNGEANSDYAYTESDKAEPLSTYGKTKYEGELLALECNPKTVIIRTAWAFSEYGNNFVKTMLHLAKDRDSLGVVSDQFGGPTYAGDIAKALIEITNQILAGKENAFGIYHFTGKPYVSWYEFAKAIFAEAELQNILEKSPLVNSIATSDYPTPAKRPANSRLDLTKIKQVFNIEPSDWQAALKNIKAYQS